MSTTLSLVARTVASKVLRLLLAAVTGVLIARSLQPEGRGAYALIANIAFTATIVGHLSLDQTQISLWASRVWRQRLTVNALVLGLALGGLTGVTVAALTMLGAMPTTSPLLCLAMLAVPFAVAGSNLRAVATLRSDMGVVNRAVIVGALIQCAPLIALCLTGRLTVAGVIVCWTISTAAPFFVFLRALRPRPRWADARLANRQLALGSRYHVGVVAFHLLLSVDVLLVHGLDSTAAVGLYTVAVTVLDLTRIPAEAVTQVVLPRQAVGGLDAASRLTVRAVRLNLLVSAGFIGLLAAASPVLVPLVYGQSFAGSVAALLALAPGTVALTLLRAIEQYLVRLGRPAVLTSILVAALVVNVVLNVVLIPALGVVGAGLASTVAYTLTALLEMAWFARATGIPVHELLPRPSTVRSLVAALLRRGADAKAEAEAKTDGAPAEPARR
ncbi:lipopolysaccharide biosynthesis protein [Nonomuraea pusilla]|uniref:Membrane protein involved in the export of O-antigen and teichoic acid n=1 Tax=Nonomuraea pusilla TaxID=46177 RepID=A0A1H7F9B0_9ACTN|nr:polysaccharide biosynthesis C-terminal domain-containing protein [Nonomuraea pusilla]SEK22696.1 Membrane protein involved in the export of O-antigen and teichoic acid [Nonomuraea pusilla]